MIGKISSDLPGNILLFISNNNFLIFLSISTYILGLSIISFAWLTLFDLEKNAKNFLHCMTAYSYANIAKYLPGNIFHIFARQGLMLKIGAGHLATATASLREALLLVISATLLCIIFIFIDPIPSIRIISTTIQIKIEDLLPILFPIAALTLVSLKPIKPKPLTFLLYIIFHLISLASFFVLLETHDKIFQISIILLISWILGFCTIGSPGGLGVREAAFIYMSSEITTILSSDLSLFYITMFRLITMSSDAILTVLMWTINYNIHMKRLNK